MRLSELSTGPMLVRRSIADRGLYPGHDAVDRDLHNWWLAFQAYAAGLSIPLRVVWGYRSLEEQQKVFDGGFSKARPGQSPHNYGKALDVIHMQRAWEHMPDAGWELLGAIGKDIARKRNLKVEWGGDWRRPAPDRLGWDAAHWQIKDWRNHISSS